MRAHAKSNIQFLGAVSDADLKRLRPFEPETALVSVAVKRSPTLLVLVQIFEPDARLSVAPAGIVPTFAAVPALVRVTVLPLDVTVDFFVVVVGVRVVGLVVRAAEALGAGFVAVAPGTSVSAGCAAEVFPGDFVQITRETGILAAGAGGQSAGRGGAAASS